MFALACTVPADDPFGDAGAVDAVSVDAGADAPGSPDTSVGFDAGAADARPADAGTPAADASAGADAPPADAGAPDAVPPPV